MKQTSISIIGIDIDFYTRSKKKQKQYLANLRERIFPFGVIIHDKPSQHGHHFKVKLNRKVSFWRSIEIRYYLQDDIKRLFYDIMRYRAGSKMYDILYDKKVYLNNNRGV